MICHALALAACLAVCSASWVNEHVKRVVDVSSTVAVSRTTIRMRNIGASDKDFFYLAVKCSDAPGLGDLWVSIPPAKGSVLRALPMERSDEVPGLDPCCSGYKVSLASPVPAGGQVTVDVRMDVAGVIKAVPEVLEGLESQYMRYVGSVYFFTPYASEEMTTSITLGSSEVTSKQGLEKPYELIGKKLKLGPYKGVGALSYQELRVRFKNDRGFLVASVARKDVYVNHLLQQISVKEELVVENAGARHVGEWSRVDHASGASSKYRTAMGDVWANLPDDATRVTYTDLIGNVTTSRLRAAAGGKQALQLSFRYPLMGGWRNHFWVAYEVGLLRRVRSSGATHEARVRLFPSLHADLLSRELVVRVFLPEWAHGVHVVAHPSLYMDVRHAVARTTLTVYGRPVVELRMRDVRSQSKHAREVVVRYSYSAGLRWLVPAAVALAVALAVAAFVLCVRSGLGMGDGDAGKMKTA